MIRFGLVLAALILSAGMARAAEWTIDPAQSKLGFIGEQSGQKFEGGFKNFSADIDFDPDHPETGKILVIVDIASAYAGDGDRDSMLPQSDWFDTAHFPSARFSSTAIRQTGPGRYEIAATLSIKGVTRDVTLPFILTRESDHWRARGKLTLMRNDFNVGLDMFAGEDYVKHAVDVTMDLAAKPQP